MLEFNRYYNQDEILFSRPDNLPENQYEEFANYYMPVDTGIEIECSLKENVSVRIFDNIPFIVENRSSSSELRLRIPSGIKGFKCLFEICEKLKEHCLLSNSGIHIHVGFNESQFNILKEKAEEYKEDILSELDTWNYKGTYNARNLNTSRNWVRLHTTYNTMEVRICEMTFDYKLLIKRILHVQYLRYKLLDFIETSELGVYNSYIDSLTNFDNAIQEAYNLIKNRTKQIQLI